MKKIFLFLLFIAILYSTPIFAKTGDIIDFEGYTLENVKMTSKEIFSANKITMINIWGSWCHYCVDELDDLAELHKKLQAKGCGIVGIEVEGDSNESTYEQAKKLLQEKGVTYPNVIIPDESSEFIKNVQAFPTTFFVDSDGQILTDPIIGAAVDEYEPTINNLLEKKK